MFRLVFHPSSGAHNTVSTVSGINETVTATCGERGWTGRPSTFTTGSSTGLINAKYCRYSVMSSWWWVKYHPKHVEQLTVLNKLYSVASCWIIIVIHLTLNLPQNMFKTSTWYRLLRVWVQTPALHQCRNDFWTKWLPSDYFVVLVQLTVVQSNKVREEYVKTLFLWFSIWRVKYCSNGLLISP